MYLSSNLNFSRLLHIFLTPEFFLTDFSDAFQKLCYAFYFKVMLCMRAPAYAARKT